MKVRNFEAFPVFSAHRHAEVSMIDGLFFDKLVGSILFYTGGIRFIILHAYRKQ